jgi:DNA invertase Pin-like site-specific DNA recombinase
MAKPGATRILSAAIGYTRVSTAEQGKSHLGLDVQAQQIRDYCARENLELLKIHEEVETGKGHDALDRRPILREAMQQARKQGATIIVSKLDRLSRSVAFISSLIAHQKSFIVVELGENVDTFVLYSLAALAERERDLISQRTREALARIKALGTRRLGNPRAAEAAALGRAALTKKADTEAQRLRPLIVGAVKQGITSNRAIAGYLNQLRIPTSRGGDNQWHGASIGNVRRRLGI